MYIDKNEFKTKGYNIGAPLSNKVYYGHINNKEHIYKIFSNKECFNNEIDIKRFEELCKRNDGSNLILPKYLIKENELEGYIANYYHGLPSDRFYIRSYATRIKYLLAIKELIKESHDKGIIHSDIHFGNILINDKYETAALIDFDNAKVDDIEPVGCIYSEIAKDYILYNEHDKYLDIFMFNLLTYATLNGTDMEYILRCKGNVIHDFFTSKTAKKTLENLSLYKKTCEFLIDMVDDSCLTKKITFNNF